MATALAPEVMERSALGPCAVYLFTCLANLGLACLSCFGGAAYPDDALRGLYVAYLVWLVTALWSWYCATGRLFDAYTLPATAIWTFNGGGLALTQVFAPDPRTAFDDLRLPVLRGFTESGVLTACLLVLFCLAALHLGALLAVSRRQAEPIRHGQTGVEKESRLWWVGMLLVGVSIVPAVWTLRVGIARVQEGGYMALYQSDPAEESTLLFMLASGLVPGAFYIMGSDLEDRRLRWAGWALVVTFSAGMLALGTRAACYQNLAALLWLRHYGVRPIRKAVWALLVVAALLLSSFVFWSRMISEQSLLSWEGLEQARAEVLQDVGEPLNEMGASVLTVVYVLDLVPAERDFCWGESYLHSMAAVVPSSLAGDYFAHRDSEENWLVETVSPETAAVGGGLGFSVIAEAYLNFGVGAPVVLGLAGVLLGTFAGWVHAAGRSGRLAFAACVISIVLFSARASSLSFVRRVVVLCGAPCAVLVCGRLLDRAHENDSRQ